MKQEVIVNHHIIGPLPSERQQNLVIGLLAQRKITGKDLQADRVGAMNADELTEWLKVKLNPITTNEGGASSPTLFAAYGSRPRATVTSTPRKATADTPDDEQRTPPRGTLPPITAGRANGDGESIFGYEDE